MTIEHLKYYVELCREKNFTEAAFACSLSQSALSKQIQRLEKELGVQLLNRNTRRFNLTEEGRIFYDYALETLNNYKTMLEKIHAKKKICIGSMAVMAPYHFTGVLAAFQTEYPETELILDEQRADHILAHMEEYDFTILRSLLITDKKKYHSILLYDDFLCAVVYQSHPLAERTSIRLEELKNEKFIFPQKGSGGYEAFFESCVRAGFTPDIQYEFPQANTIMSFVKEKMGITINFTQVYRESGITGLCMIPLENPPHYPISLYYPRKKILQEEKRAFICFIKEWKKANDNREIKMRDS